MREVARDVAAYHEAGHAVAAAMLGIPVMAVSIRPDGDEAGRVLLELDAAPVADRVVVLLAGQVGTWMRPAFDGDVTHPGCKRDLEVVARLLGSADPFTDPRYLAASRRVADLLHQERASRAVHALAAMLLEREEIAIAADVEAAELLASLRP